MTLIENLSSAGSAVAAFAGLPILIWTLLCAAVLILMHVRRNLHVQYHYHVRLALIIALPFGLLMTGLVELASGWWNLQSEGAASLKFIYVQAPVEIAAAEAADTSSLLLSSRFWYAAGMILFLAGASAMLMRYLLQFLRLTLLNRKLLLQPIGSVGEVSGRNRDLARQCGTSVYLAFPEQSVVPVTYGFRKPVVLLPAFLKDDPERMNLVLRHELMHVKHRDYLTQLVLSGIRALFWFHPLIHLVCRQLVDYREMRCDSHVLADQTVSRKKYASVLLELLPLPNLNRNISVNMAQESSNLKKRITMMNILKTRSIPVKTSFSLFFVTGLTIILAMSCTDMQTHNILDEEELDILTDVDATGERGYHEIIFYMGDDEQSERHQSTLDRMNALQPEHIQSVNVLRGGAAEEYGPRAANGVVVIRTRQDMESYHRALRVLGMEVPPEPPQPDTVPEDYFVVVEDMPELIGGLRGLQEKVEYPEMAHRAGIEGRVYVQFIVNEEGRVENPQVIRGIGGGADEEALRVVSEARFTPGMQRGRPVRVQYSLPMVFRLNTENE